MVGLDEIKVDLPVTMDNDTTILGAGSQRNALANNAATVNNGSGNGSNMDSYNDDDEIEDEKLNPAAMQINHSSSVTRAGAQRNAFGPGPRQISSQKPKPNWGAYGSPSLPQILEIGTEETVIRYNNGHNTNDPLKL